MNEKISKLLENIPLKEEIAKRIYQEMRFGRLEQTPEWVAGGNAQVQENARVAADNILSQIVQNLVE